MSDPRDGAYLASVKRKADIRTVRLPGVSGMTIPENASAPLYSDALGAEFRNRQAMKRVRSRVPAQRMPFIEWALLVPEAKAGTLNFDRFPFQKSLYTESGELDELVVQKPTQVGISAFLVRNVLFFADTRGATGLYVFPKRKQMYDFADARVNAIVQKSPFLKEKIRDVDNKGLKRVGLGFVYFRGSESEDDLDSVDADIVALDEYNRLLPKNIPVAERRISGPNSLGMIRRVGVPTSPNFGIDRLYRASDRRRWMVRCPSCTERQALTWADNVDVDTARRVCRECRGALAPDDIRAGEWVAEALDGDRPAGYAMNKLMVPDLSAAAVRGLVENSRKTLPEDRQAFWNRDMGIAFAPEEGRLSPEAVAAATSIGAAMGSTARAPGYIGDNVITMGVDVASARALNVRVSEQLPHGKKKALFVGLVDSFDELDRMMSRYDVNMCVIDHAPEGRMSIGFAEKFAGRVYTCSYASNQTDVFRVDEDRRMITVRRVESIDATLEAIRAQRNGLPPDAPYDYASQLGSVNRVVEKRDDGRKVVRYESSGPDDYVHAENFDTIAEAAWVHRQSVDEALGPEWSKLEDHMEFERSAIHDDDDDTVYEEFDPESLK